MEKWRRGPRKGWACASAGSVEAGRHPLPPSVRGGCVGAGEGRPEGMERDTESLGPCGEVVRGILGDRFKVGFGGCCGGGGFCCWFLVFGWLL